MFGTAPPPFTRHTIASGASSKDFDFWGGRPEWIRVKFITVATPDPAWLTYGVDYTVALNVGAVGGTVTFTPPLVGAGVVEIERRASLAQPRRFTDIERFSVEAVEAGLDQVTQIAGELDERLGRALLIPRGLSIAPLDLDVPPAAGKAPRVSDDGTRIEWVSLTSTDAIEADVAALEAALDLKAPLASPALTGTPTAPTAAPGTNTTQLATTGFVKAAIDAVLNGVSATYDTLAEIATDLGTRALKATTISGSGLATGGGDLSANRTITVTAASASEARALAATDRALTPANLADLGARRTLGNGAVAVSLTGTTTETVLATVSVPAAFLGPNGLLLGTALWSFTNSANMKTLRVRLGGIGGTVIDSATPTTQTSQRRGFEVNNRNSQTSQVTCGTGSTGGWGPANAPVTPAIDTSAAVDVVFTGQLANAGETITLESYFLEAIKRS